MQGASIEQLQSICPVDCHTSSKPEIALQGPREYIITNAEKNRAVVECPSGTKPLEGPSIGSISVQLPCDCALLIDAHRVDEDSFPCTVPHIKRAVVNHTMPAIFATKYPSVKVAVNKPVLLPVGNDVNNILDPTIDIFDANTLAFKTPSEDDLELHEWVGTTIQENHHYLLYLWLIICTLLIVYIFVFFKPKARPMRAPVAFSMAKLIPTSDARRPYTNNCVLPTHLEVLLWVYLVVTVILTAPYVCKFISNACSKYKREKALGKDWMNIFSNGTTGHVNRRIEDFEADLVQRENRGENNTTNNPNSQGRDNGRGLHPQDPALHRL